MRGRASSQAPVFILTPPAPAARWQHPAGRRGLPVLWRGSVRTASAAIGLCTSPWSAASRPLEASARHTRRRNSRSTTPRPSSEARRPIACSRRRCCSTARRVLGATRRAMRWAARAAGTVPSRAFVIDAKGAAAAEGSPRSPHRHPQLRLVRIGLVMRPLVSLLAALSLPQSLRVGFPGACFVLLHCWGSDTPQHAAVVIHILLYKI